MYAILRAKYHWHGHLQQQSANDALETSEEPVPVLNSKTGGKQNDGWLSDRSLRAFDTVDTWKA